MLLADFGAEVIKIERPGVGDLARYLFAAHNWGLRDLRALWEGETGWHDLIYALASYEANQKAEAAKERQPGAKIIKRTKRAKK